MIRVKSAQGSGSGKEEAGRPEFAADPGGGRGPLVFGLTLTAVLLYLKSFLPMAEAGEAPEEARDAASREGGDAPDGRPEGAAVAPGIPPDTEAAGAVAADLSSVPSAAGGQLPVQWIGAQGAGWPVSLLPRLAIAANLPAPPPPGRGPTWLPEAEPMIRFPGLGEVEAGPGASVEVGATAADGDPTVGGSDDEPDPEGPGPGLPNRAPRNSGPVYLADLGTGGVLLMTLSMLLGRSTDPDGDTLAVTGVEASRGTLVQGPDGWTYTADGDAPGPVSFRYTVSDGTADVEQVAHLRIVPGAAGEGGAAPGPATGTPEDEAGDGPAATPEPPSGAALVGTPEGDVLRGGDGDDVLSGGGGNDTVFGGAGDDVISGGNGDDALHGETGDDVLHGDEGNDALDGGDGSDVLFGGAGHDRLAGGSGDDVLEGGTGNDALAGGTGDDMLAGGAGDDRLDGGAGNDRLLDGAGADVVEGGAGDDVIRAAADAEDDRFSGGDGVDLLDCGDDTAGVVFDLAEGVASGAGIGTDRFDGIEAFAGGAGDDVFLAAGSCGRFAGGEGDDLYVFEEERLALDNGTLRFQITDFAVGDRISLGSLNLFQRGRGDRPDEKDLMEDLYKALREFDFGDDRPRLRLREDNDDDAERTLIEIDFDRDRIYETTITLEGMNLVAYIDVS